jgi:2-haloacid dehalogenase
MSGTRRVRACVFDAYGTLFDLASVAQAAADGLADGGRTLIEVWRSKQLQYTWLRGLAGRHADFLTVTGESLDFAMESLGIRDPPLRARLLDGFLRIAAYPDVLPCLERLREAGITLAILSNGTPDMLEQAATRAGIRGHFAAVLSVESAGVYKPHPDVYRLATERLALPAEQIGFVSANSWDAWAAKAFGFHVLWCNRFAQTPERLAPPPDRQIRDLASVASGLGLAG